MCRGCHHSRSPSVWWIFLQIKCLRRPASFIFLNFCINLYFNVFFYLFCLSWMPSCQGAFPKSDWFSSRKKPVLTCIFYLFLCVLRWKTCTMKVFLNFTFIQDLESWRQITNASSADSAGFLNRGVQNWRDFPSLWFDFDRLTFWGVQNWPNFPALCYGLSCSKWEKAGLLFSVEKDGCGSHVTCM